MTAIVKHALRYAELGWPVLPLHSIADGRCTCGRPDCSSPGKHPRTPHGLHDATTDPEQIRCWWRNWPNANIGLVTGHPTFAVLDVDPRNGGDITLQLLEEEHGPLPITKHVRTGNGDHYYFKCQKGLRSGTNRLGPGLDLKAEGGYVVASPSLHISGRHYHWKDMDVELAELPAWILKTTEPERTGKRAQPTTPLQLDDADKKRLWAALAVIDSDPRDIWIKVGAALRHALGDRGRRFWDEWSKQSDKFDPDDQERTWQSFKEHSNPAGLGSIYYLARPENEAADGLPKGASVSSVSSDPGGLPEFAPFRPLPGELLPVPPFDPELLPDAFRDWCQDVADRIQCPIDFAAAGVMVAYSSVVGRRLGIRPKRQDDWTVVPNLWGAGVGRPGTMKSPAFEQAMKMLVELEAAAKAVFEDEEVEHEATRMVADAARKELQKQISKNAVSDREKALRLARESVNDKPEPPTRKRFFTSDTTVEKLGELLASNPTGIIVFRDELIGLLRSLDREGQEGSRSFYLEAWNGTGRFTYDRIGRGTIDIEAAIVSILGGIQPGPLQAYLLGAVRSGAEDDGLIPRFQLLVWPDISGDWENVDRWPDTEALQRVRAAFRAAAELDPEALGAQRDGDGGIPFLRFDNEAQALIDEWRAGLERTVRSGKEHPAIEAHLSKYRSLVPALALLLHVADGRRGPVGADSARRAIAWARYLEAHARRVYGSVLGSVIEARTIAHHILQRDLEDGFTLRQVYRPGWTSIPDKAAAERGIDLLIRLGWLAEQERKTEGRWTTVYRVNPRVREYGQRGG